MSHTPGGHDPVQAPVSPLGPPGLLALAQLGVEAPECDQQNCVADGPEETKHTEAWDYQVPQLQVAQLGKDKFIEQNITIKHGIQICNLLYKTPANLILRNY